MPDEDEDQIQDDPANLRQRMRALEKERNDLRGKATAGEEAQKKLAIYEAGITDPQQIKLLSRLHDGEWTAEAVRETIAEYGVTGKESGAADEVDERDEAMRQLAPVASGAGGHQTRRTPVDDDQALQEELNEWWVKNIPEKGRLADKQDSIDQLNRLLRKWEVKGPGLSAP
jgi:hypothetical protein